MNFLSVENLTKSFGDRILFENLTFGIDQGQKVAIVAKNGSGKTTLLKCLTGKESCDDGRVVFRKDMRVAFMEQAEDLPENETIIDCIFNHDLPELQLIKRYNQAMLENDDEAITGLYQELSDLNAWDIEVRVEQILSTLKLTNGNQLIGSLSGGQKAGCIS